MAAFFKNAAPPGAVVRAEQLFIRRRLARGATPTCAWRRTPDGRLVCGWAESARDRTPVAAVAL
jgi:hypothetical protein